MHREIAPVSVLRRCEAKRVSIVFLACPMIAPCIASLHIMANNEISKNAGLVAVSNSRWLKYLYGRNVASQTATAVLYYLYRSDDLKVNTERKRKRSISHIAENYFVQIDGSLIKRQESLSIGYFTIIFSIAFTM